VLQVIYRTAVAMQQSQKENYILRSNMRLTLVIYW